MLGAGLLAAPSLGASASSTVQSGTSPAIGGFSARALGERGEVTPKTYFEVELPPGGSFEGRILVTNAANAFTRLRVDSVDGLTGQTSGTVYANRTDPRAETSRWITPAKEALRLDASSSRTLGFRVQVPRDARPGDHVGAVAFQRIVNPKKKGDFAVRQVLRVAVAIQITVRGPAKAQLKVGTLGLQALAGTQIPSVTVQLRNTGQLLCRPMLTVTLSRDGASLGSVERQLDTILAGDAIDYPLPWGRPLDAGTYEATARATGCGTQEQAQQTVKLERALVGSTTAPGPDSAALDDGGSGVPWWAFALGILAALGVGYAVARRGRREPEDPADRGTPVPQAQPEPEPEPSRGAVVIEPIDPPRAPGQGPTDGGLT